MFEPLTGIARDAASAVVVPARSISMAAGETGTIPVTIYHADGVTPYNLTGCSVALVVWGGRGFAQPLISRPATIVNASAGMATIPILVGDTLGMPGSYAGEIWLTDGNFAPNLDFRVSGVFTWDISPSNFTPGMAVTVPPSQQPLGLGLNWRGAWSSSTSYGIHDGVSYPDPNGGGAVSSFVCLVANTNTPPVSNLGALNSDWNYVAAAGGAVGQQTANLVFAGPSSGSAVAPTFRSLVVADLPAFGAVMLERFAGADLGARIVNAIASLPATGGTIDARGFTGTHTISSTVTFDRSAEVLLGAAQITSTAATTFAITAGTGKAPNVKIRGIDPYSTTITSANNGVIFSMSGDFFDNVGSGKQQIEISGLTLVGGGGTSQAIVTGGFPSTNFQNGEILITDCYVTGFGGRAAFDIGNSIYFNRLYRNYFSNNITALRIDNNSESSVCENWFFQGQGGGPNFIYIGPMCLCDHNYWYRYTANDTSTAPDIQLMPVAAWGSQSGGYIWITNSRFGGEHECLDNARNRIQVLSDPTADPSHTVIGGPVHILDNFFIGGTGTGTISYTANAGTAQITLSAGKTTQGLSGRSLTLVNGPAGLNGVFAVASVIDTLNFTVTVPSPIGSNLSGSIVVTATDVFAIGIYNPTQAMDIRGNTFLNCSHVWTAQPDSSSTIEVVNSVYKDNFAPQSSGPGYTVMGNGGRLFSVVQPPLDAADFEITASPRSVESRYLNNRVFKSETLGAWTATNGLAVTTGQTDPWGTTRAALLTLSGTTPSSQAMRQQIDTTTTLPSNGRLTVKFWAKAGASNTMQAGVFNSTTGLWSGNLQTFNLSSAWKEYKVTTNPIPSGNTCFLEFFPGANTWISGSAYVVAPQVSDFDCSYYPNLLTNVGTASDTTVGLRLEQALQVNTIQPDASTALTLNAPSGISAAGPITFTGTPTLNGAAGLNLNAPSGTWAAQIGGSNILALTSTTVDVLQFAKQTGNKNVAIIAAAADTAAVSFTIQGQAGGPASAVGGGVGGTTVVQGGPGGTGTASLNPGGGGTLDLIGGAAGSGGTGNASGGAVVMRGGLHQGTGTDGVILIGDANTSSITMGSTTTTLAISGSAPSLRGNTSLTLDSGSGTLHLQVSSADVLALTSATVDTLQFARNTGAKNIAIAAAPVDTAGVTFSVLGQQGGTASVTGGGLGGILLVQAGQGGNGTGGLNPGNGATLELFGGPAGTGGSGNSTGGQVLVRGGLHQGTGANGNVSIGDTNTHNINIGNATGDSGSATTTTFAGTLTFPSGSIAIAALSANQYTVSAGAGLSGGGTASLGGSLSVSMPNTGPGATTTGGGGVYINSVQTDAQGRIVALTTGTPAGTGTVTSVATDSTLTGGPITGSGTLGIALNHANTWTAYQAHPAGSGTMTGNPLVTLRTVVSSSTSSTGSAVTVDSVTLKQNTLDTNGQSLRIFAWATHASNTNAATFRIKLGSVTLASLSQSGSNISGAEMTLEVICTRTNSTTIACRAVFIYGGTVQSNGQFTIATVTDLGSGGDQTLSWVFDVATANSDLTARLWRVDWLSA